MVYSFSKFGHGCTEQYFPWSGGTLHDNGKAQVTCRTQYWGPNWDLMLELRIQRAKKTT